MKKLLFILLIICLIIPNIFYADIDSKYFNFVFPIIYVTSILLTANYLISDYTPQKLNEKQLTYEK